VPTDVSVVSFDDDAIASWVRPGLTTIAIPHYDLGRAAVDVLFDEIDRAHGETHRQPMVHRVEMPVRTRDSVAPPSA
jgi:LacI family transcriptional regulator